MHIVMFAFKLFRCSGEDSVGNLISILELKPNNSNVTPIAYGVDYVIIWGEERVVVKT